MRHSGFVNGLEVGLFIELSGFTPRLGSLPCVLALVTLRVVNGKCKNVRLTFFFTSLENFDFLKQETETLKHFICRQEMLRLYTM